MSDASFCAGRKAHGPPRTATGPHRPARADGTNVELGTQEKTVGLWRRRLAEQGSVSSGTRRGRGDQRRRCAGLRRVVRNSTRERSSSRPRIGATLAAERIKSGASEATRVEPQLVRTFKVSNDPHFAEKLEDIVGLYLNPPEHALVFSVDEKSQIQALDRTQPGLPIKKGRAGTMTHDYKRNGTTTLFAALCTLTGSSGRACRATDQEWIKFLALIDREVPTDFEVHLICDNYATHNHAKVQRWLHRHPRFHASRRPAPPG